MASSEKKLLKTWLDGKDTEQISLNNRGLLYGDGLFTTAILKNNKIQLLQRHLDRFTISAAAMNYDLDANHLLSLLQEFIGTQANATLKIILIRKGEQRSYHDLGQRGVHVIFQMYENVGNADMDDKRLNGVEVYLCNNLLSQNKALAGHKHLNRIENVLARSEASAEQFPEGLMLDTSNNLIEACMSNIFICRNNIVSTPELELSGVKGVMRQEILCQLSKHDVEVVEGKLSLEDLLNCDEAFLTNSIIGIWPIKKFNDKVWSKFELSRQIDVSSFVI